MHVSRFREKLYQTSTEVKCLGHVLLIHKSIYSTKVKRRTFLYTPNIITKGRPSHCYVPDMKHDWYSHLCETSLRAPSCEREAIFPFSSNGPGVF